MDWQLSDLIVYEFHWKRLINKDECDGRTCMFIVCLTSTHLNLEILFKRRILVLRTATSSHLQLRFRYLGKFWCGIAVFSLYHVRYCGIRTPPYAPLLLRKDLLNWSLAEFFSNITDCHSCHRRYAVSFPPSSVHFFEDQVIGLHVLQKDHDLFLPFLHTMSATDHTWNMSAFLCCLFVCFSFISQVLIKEPKAV